MELNSKIFVAGHNGLVGSAICRILAGQGFERVITANRKQVDLRDRTATLDFFATQKPEYVFLAAARVGGILANSNFPVDFLHENLAIQLNVFEAAHLNQVRKVEFLGSSCIYPKFAPQPMREEHLLSGVLEPTNEPYAIAKIAGIKLGQAYRRQYGMSSISLMPTNLYGPNDNFDLQSSHVLPAMIRKFHEAKIAASPNVVVWGTGTPKREFLHVDDMAGASVFLMKNYDSADIVNVGTGVDFSIGELASLVREVIAYPGEIIYDTTKPDGTPRKLLDVSKLTKLGWTAKIGLKAGIASTYEWFLQNRKP